MILSEDFKVAYLFCPVSCLVDLSHCELSMSMYCDAVIEMPEASFFITLVDDVKSFLLHHLCQVSPTSVMPLTSRNIYLSTPFLQLMTQIAPPPTHIPVFSEPVAAVFNHCHSSNCTHLVTCVLYLYCHLSFSLAGGGCMCRCVFVCHWIGDTLLSCG